MNELLEITFVDNSLFFISANISEISYGLDQNKIIFCYYPDQYEYGKIMNSKGAIIHMNYDRERQYSIRGLNSFFKNECEFYEVSNAYRTLEEQIDSVKIFLQNLKLNKTNWEEKFILYKKSITPTW